MSVRPRETHAFASSGKRRAVSRATATARAESPPSAASLAQLAQLSTVSSPCVRVPTWAGSAVGIAEGFRCCQPGSGSSTRPRQMRRIA